MKRFEGTKADRRSDKIGAKEQGVSDRAWEDSPRDKAADAMRDYGTYAEAHKARKRGDPQRIPFHVDAHGPFFKDRVLNRDGHDPFKGTDK